MFVLIMCFILPTAIADNSILDQPFPVQSRLLALEAATRNMTCRVKHANETMHASSYGSDYCRNVLTVAKLLTCKRPTFETTKNIYNVSIIVRL